MDCQLVMSLFDRKVDTVYTNEPGSYFPVACGQGLLCMESSHLNHESFCKRATGREREPDRFLGLEELTPAKEIANNMGFGGKFLFLTTCSNQMDG